MIFATIAVVVVAIILQETEAKPGYCIGPCYDRGQFCVIGCHTNHRGQGCINDCVTRKIRCYSKCRRSGKRDFKFDLLDDFTSQV